MNVITNNNNIPTPTIHLFSKLDNLLIELLLSLNNDEWHKPTIAKLWTVKDIAAHLLDGNLRGISIGRDSYLVAPDKQINSYTDLVQFLNDLNKSWTNAAKRLSPQVLISLLESTGKEYTSYIQSLNPFDKAIFPVAWAGENESLNWFHIAREYTEKFIHQQQIRDAVNKQTLFTRELFYPFIDTIMYALSYTYRNVSANINTIINVHITTEIGGIWNLKKTQNGWELFKDENWDATATIKIEPYTAWKLFSKGISKDEAMKNIEIIGDKNLGIVVLDLVGFMV
ncbi:MAG: maleylpyruvate isomerase N-terminal domain-containing protein [Chitinophagaceae bacterium]